MQQERDNRGRWTSIDQPNIIKIDFKASEGLQKAIKKAAGNNVSAWIREAIQEKLEKEASTP